MWKFPRFPTAEFHWLMGLRVLEEFSSFCTFIWIKIPIFGSSLSVKILAWFEGKHYIKKPKNHQRTTLNREKVLLAFSANQLERLITDMKAVYDWPSWYRASDQNFKSASYYS